MATDKNSRSNCDWERVEVDYRAGLLSIREIGRIHGVSEAMIRKKASQNGWERDLTARVNEKVRTDLVRSEVRTTNPQTEQKIIDEAAATVVSVVRSHRKTIKRGNEIVERLIQQLDDAMNGRAELEAAIEEETADDKTTERKSRMKKAVSLEKHAQIMFSLAQSTKILIGLERQAFNIPDVAGPSGNNDMPDEERRARLAELRGKMNATD